MVVLGRLGAPYGVRGWLRVHPETAQPGNLLSYRTLRVEKGDRRERMQVEQGQRHGRGVVVKFAGVTSRESAARWTGAVIGIDRSELPPLADGEYYWEDLIGLQVLNDEGVVLGTVTRLLETGAHDLLVIGAEPEILVPYVVGDVIRSIDLDQGVMVVAWDPDY